MKSLWDWALASMIAWRNFSSSLLRFPFIPTMGWLQRVTVAWLSGWIHDSTCNINVQHNNQHKCSITGGYWIWAAYSQVSFLLHGRQPLSSVLRLVCWQVPLKLMGRCHKDRSDHLPSLSSSFHWVYPLKHKQDAHIFKKNKTSLCQPVISLWRTCLLYSETASYTFHPFSGKTCPYSKAKICYTECETDQSMIIEYHFRDSVNDDNSPGHWKQERQISSILQKWTSWVCPLFVCVQIVGDAHPAQKRNRSRSGTCRLLANAMLIRLFRF